MCQRQICLNINRLLVSWHCPHPRLSLGHPLSSTCRVMDVTKAFYWNKHGQKQGNSMINMLENAMNWWIKWIKPTLLRPLAPPCANQAALGRNGGQKRDLGKAQLPQNFEESCGAAGSPDPRWRPISFLEPHLRRHSWPKGSSVHFPPVAFLAQSLWRFAGAMAHILLEMWWPHLLPLLPWFCLENY